MSDILTRLLLDTKGYDGNLLKAKKSTENFTASITGKLGGAVTKLAGGLGLAMGAAETFDRVMKSSQTTGDKYAETLEGLKAGVDAFFTSLSTGDFSSFNDGLSTVIAKARQAYNALDQLGNAQMSFDLAQTMNQRDIANAMQLAKNKFAPTDVRVGAFGDWKTAIQKQEQQSAQLASDIQSYVSSAVEAAAGLKGFSANIQNVTEAMLLDIQDEAKRAELKKQYSSEYSTFQTELKAAEKARNKASVGKNPWDRERMQAEQAYNARVKQLTEQYNKAITVNALLVKYEDDQLKALGGYMRNMIQLDSATANLKREYNETANEFNNANKGAKGFTPITAFEGYAVYSDSGRGTGKGKTIKKEEKMPVVTPQIQYDTSIGKKMLEAMNGKTFEPIHVPIVIEEDIDEEDLSGKWAEHLAKEEKKVQDMNSALSSTADIFGSLGSIAGTAGNDFLAATMQSMGSIAQMIMQLQALTTAQGVSSASKLPFPANLAAIATVVATIASVFASLPKFADGGVVGGSSYFGDKLLARVNSGEAILTQTQQARALSLMNGGGDVRVSGDVRLSGKDIYISLRNYMASSGNKL